MPFHVYVVICSVNLSKSRKFVISISYIWIYTEKSDFSEPNFKIWGLRKERFFVYIHFLF